MNKMNKYTLFTLSFMLLSSCGVTSTDNFYEFNNNGFEYGDLTGWTAGGGAFDDVSVQISDSSGRKNRVVGDFFLDSGTHGEEKVGWLKSESFVVKGNGKIGLMLGGARDKSKSYVSLIAANTEQEIARISNNHFSAEVPSRTLYRHILDGGQHIGKTVYLKIIDNDESNQVGSHLLVDDIILNFQGNEDIGTLIQDARDYTAKYKDEVGQDFRHKYHLMPTIGWMNDPNGLVFHRGKYHLFYQHNPYSSNWDTMHWGHAVSEDLIKWEDAEVALAPDMAIDKFGIFSGGAISDDHEALHLLYTAVGQGGVQQQGLATSFDGLNFSKRDNNPVIDSQMRNGSRITDFRDPFVYKIDDTYYALIGGKLESPGGQLLLYKSRDLLSWTTVGTTYASTLTGTGMFECPNVINIDGKDIILTSPQAMRNQDIAAYQNIHSVTYQIGKIDYTNGLFTNDYGHDTMKEFDKGFDFYATQTIQSEDENIMLAWMNMWSRSYPSAVDGWAGAVTLPRHMKLIDGHIYQQPINALKNYYTNKVEESNVTVSSGSQSLSFSGNVMTFKAELDVNNLGLGKAGFEVFKGKDQATRIYYDAELKMVVFDRRNSGLRIDSTDDDGELNVRYARVQPDENGIINLEFFLDVSSVEVFINDGYYTMSGVVYPDSSSRSVSFFVEGGSATISNLVKHDIEVI